MKRKMSGDVVPRSSLGVIRKSQFGNEFVQDESEEN